MGKERYVLWLTGFGHGLSHAWELIFPVLAAKMALDFDVPLEAFIRWSFWLYLLFGCGAPLSGYLADHYGAKPVLVAGLIGGGLSGLFVAWSPTPIILEWSLAGLGLSASLYHPAGMALLSRTFDKKLGRAFAANGIAGAVGIALTPAVAGLFAVWVGWRGAFVALTVPGFLAGLFFLLWRAPMLDDTVSPERSSGSVGEPGPWYGSPSLLWVGLAVIGGGLVYRLHTLTLPSILEERSGALGTWMGQHAQALFSASETSTLVASGLTSLAYGMGILGQWVGGRVADHRRLVPAYFAYHLAAVPLLAVSSQVEGASIVAFLTLYIFFGLGLQPVENRLVAAMTPSGARGRVYAAKFVLSFGVGSLGTYMVGWVAPFGGLRASLALASVLEVAVLLPIAVLWVRDAAKAKGEVVGRHGGA